MILTPLSAGRFQPKVMLRVVFSRRNGASGASGASRSQAVLTTADGADQPDSPAEFAHLEPPRRTLRSFGVELTATSTPGDP